MAYVINKFSGPRLTVLEDGTLDTTTSIGLVGRNYSGYGEVFNENFLFLLENFANTIAPSRPIAGQTWYNTATKTLYAYSGSGWSPTGGATVSNTAPNVAVDAASTSPIPGSLWYKEDSQQLYISNGAAWQLVGPEGITGYNKTKFQSAVIKDIDGGDHPASLLYIDNNCIAIASYDNFTISTLENLPGFLNIQRGINLPENSNLIGNVIGNAQSATSLANYITINSVPFNGSTNITVKASTTNSLVRGSYLIGSNFDGSTERTWSVDATPNNIIGKVVARDSAGDFSARRITAEFIGNLSGNVVTATGTSFFNIIEANEIIGRSISGNSRTSTKLETARTINGVLFDGTANITVPAAANTLTGTAIPANVTTSFLTSIGTLNELVTGDIGVKVGSNNQLRLYLDSNTPTIESTVANSSLNFEINDTPQAQNNPGIGFLTSAAAVSLGGDAFPTFSKIKNGTINLGLPDYPWNKIYATEFNGSVVKASNLMPTTGSSTITITADLILTGDFTIQGTSTFVNSTNVTVADKTLTLGAGSLNSSAANGAGIIIDGSLASFTYATTGDKWVSNKDIDIGANTFRGVATSAQYADLAENYVADNKYEAGVVVEIGGSCEITLANKHSRKIAGIISTNPAYLMNDNCQGNYVLAVALQGRVPCKVKGKIVKGDLMISAGNGYAESSQNPLLGSLIGKALEDFDGEEGIIEVLVGLG